MTGVVSQEELDRQYSPSRWSHRFSAEDAILNYMTVTTQGSERVRQKLRHDLNCPVPESSQTVDIYWPDCPAEHCNAVFAFVHGGNWQACNKSHQAYLAEPFTSQKVVVVTIGYSIAPGGKLEKMMDQVRAALSYLSHRFSGCRLCVAGHSAGAHLVAMAACCGERKSAASSPVKVHGLALISGIFDLDPVRKSYVNNELHLSAEEARLFSPAHQHSGLSSVSSYLDVLLAIGEHDSLEFRCQSMDYAELLRAHGVRVVNMLDIDDEDHFSIVEKLSSNEFSLTKAILQMLGK